MIKNTSNLKGEKVKKSINFTAQNLEFINSLDTTSNLSRTVNSIMDKVRERLSDFVVKSGGEITPEMALNVIAGNTKINHVGGRTYMVTTKQSKPKGR